MMYQADEKHNMDVIEFYQALKRIPDTTDAQAQSIANSFAHADDVATKTDLAMIEMKMATKADLAGLEVRLVKWMVATGGILIAAIGLITKL